MRIFLCVCAIFVVGLLGAQGFSVQVEQCQEPDGEAVVHVQDLIEGEYEVSLWRVESVEWLLRRAPRAEHFRWKRELADEAAAAALLANTKTRPNALSDKPDAELKKIKPHLTHLWTKTKKGELIKETGVWKQRVIKLGRLQKGVYLVRLRRTVFEAWGYICVTSMDVVVRMAGNDLLVWVVKKATGEPVGAATVKLLGAKVERKTPANGLVLFEKPRAGMVTVLVHNKDETAFATTWSGSPRRLTKLYIYTDRPLYRPGERVYFRGVVREVTPDGPRYPGEVTVRWRVHDPKWRRIAQGQVKTSRFGTFSATIKLPEKPTLGVWSLQAYTRNGYSRIRFEVRAYRKPDFTVQLETDRAAYVQGHNIKVKVNAKYLFGPPVTEAELTLRVHCNPWLFDPFGRRPGFRLKRLEVMPQPILLMQKKVRLIKGSAEIEVPTKRLPYDALFLLEAQVTDKTSGIAVFASQTVPVTRAAFALALMPERNIYMVGEEAKVTVRVRGFGQPVSGIPVRLALYDTRCVRVALELLRTDNLGRASCSFRIPQPGYYRIIARATDNFDNPVSAHQTVLVVSKTGGLPPGSAWLEIIPDKESYRPGETARFVILSSAVPAWRLLTIESTSLHEARVLKIDSSVQIVEVRITENMAPALFIWVGSFHKAEFAQAIRMVMVEPISHRLNIQSRLTPEEGRPGKEVTIEVTLKDNHDNPLQGEFSLALVDEALFVLKEQHFDDPVRFFLPRPHGARASHAAGKRLIPPSSHRLLWRKFRAAWEKEQQEIHKILPPPPVKQARRALAKRLLKEDAGGPVAPEVEAFEETDEANRLGAVAERKEEHAAPGAAKTSGHVGLAEIPKSVYLRKEFATTAFWRAHIVTDTQGKATLKIKLPDNITTWRITMVGVTETRFGVAKSRFMSRLPVMAQILHPRFMRVGDVALLGVRGHNETGKKTAIGVRFEAQNLEGPTVTNEAEIRTGEHITAEGLYKARKPCEAVLRAAARSDTEADATEVKMVILPVGERQNIGGVWRLGKEPVKWVFELPDDAMALDVRAAVSFGYAAAVQQSLRYLVGYPYGCVEQTMSRFLPSVLAARAFQHFGFDLPAGLQQKMRRAIVMGLKRLYNFQHTDGGWGWWKSDPTHPFMTAYVVWGLTAAREADVVVNRDVLTRGVAALERLITRMRPGKGNYNQKCYMLWALAKAAPDRAKKYIDLVFDDPQRRRAKPYTKALIAMALALCGRKKDAKSLVEELLKEAQKEGGLHWLAEGYAFRRHLDPIETTAYCARALAAVGRLAEAATACAWLLSKRRGNKWRSTRDTAACVIAIVESMKKPPHKKKELTIAVNRKQALKTELPQKGVATFKLDPKLFTSGKNRIEISGTEGLVVSITCQFNSVKIVRPAQNFTVTRRMKKIAFEEGKRTYTVVGEVKESIRQDEFLLVEVELMPKGNYNYIVVEVPLPAGCEVVESATNRYCRTKFWWMFREIWDDKVVYLLNYVEKGKPVKVSFIMRGAYKGRFKMPPVKVSLMYYPEINGYSEALTLEVK